MNNSKIKQWSAIFMALAMVLFLIPCESVFASNADMTISGGVLTVCSVLPNQDTVDKKRNIP